MECHVRCLTSEPVDVHKLISLKHEACEIITQTGSAKPPADLRVNFELPYQSCTGKFEKVIQRRRTASAVSVRGQVTKPSGSHINYDGSKEGDQMMLFKSNKVSIGWRFGWMNELAEHYLEPQVHDYLLTSTT